MWIFVYLGGGSLNQFVVKGFSRGEVADADAFSGRQLEEGCLYENLMDNRV